METFTITVIFMLVALAVAIVALPLWQKNHAKANPAAHHPGQTPAEDQARYQAALAAIKELMFDYEMGKITPADYEPLLTQAKLEAAAIRQRLDRWAQNAGEVNPDSGLNREIEALIAQARPQLTTPDHPLRPEIEAEISRLKQAAAPAGQICGHCGAPRQPGDAFCSRCGQALARAAGGVCPVCGGPVQPGDAFCSRCGAAQEAPA